MRAIDVDANKLIMISYPMETSSVIVGWAIFILILEYIMWDIFHRKMTRICLPNEMDTPLLRLFTLARMGFLVIIHTIVIAGIVTTFTFLLW